jgi:hypothetical protein
VTTGAKVIQDESPEFYSRPVGLIDSSPSPPADKDGSRDENEYFGLTMRAEL